MNINFYERKGQEILSVNFIVPVGLKTIYEGKRNNIAHLIEHLLFHGHPTLCQYELMLKLEAMGAIANAETNNYYTELYVRIQEKHLKEAVILLSEAILTFDIRRTDYEQEREIIRIEEAGWSSGEDSVATDIVDSCFEATGKDKVPGYVRLKDIYQKLYKNWSLVIIGDVSFQLQEEVKNLIKNGEGEKIPFPQNVLTGKMIYKNMCFHKRLGDKNLFAYVHECSKTTGVLEMKLIRNIYVTGLSSVLYDRLVAEENYCYSVGFKDYMVENKFFIIYFTYEDVNFNKFKLYFEEIFSINFMINLSEKDIRRAINLVITDTLLKRESTCAIMNDIVEDYVFGQDLTINRNVFGQLMELDEEGARMAVMKALF